MIDLSFDVSHNVKLKVNEVLGEITTFFIELCEDSGDFSVHLKYIFPDFLVRNEIEKCKNVIYDIREYTNDGYLHQLSPLYKYALYHLIQWYIDVSINGNKIEIDTSDTEVASGDDEYILNSIRDLETYEDFLFYDLDFLGVDNFTNIFFKSPNVLNYFGINLNEFTELMPYDIKKRYYQQTHSSEDNEESIDLEDLIIRTIYTAVKQQERDPRRLNKTSENELSDTISNILQASLYDKGVITAREQQCGYALKSVGELDFYLYSHSNHTLRSLAIGENKEWGNYQKHFKQLIGYMNESIEFGFTILFNKNTKLSTILRKREEYLKEFAVEKDGEKYFETIELVKDFQGLDNVLVSKHRNPEDDNLFKVYHFIVNAYRPEREEAAKQART